MDAIVFRRSSSMLINDIATQDVSLSKGLRKGDLLSPFLFVLFMEGLNSIMKKVTCEGKFRGFELAEDISFNILQFTDDTILLGEGC